MERKEATWSLAGTAGLRQIALGIEESAAGKSPRSRGLELSVPPPTPPNPVDDPETTRVASYLLGLSREAERKIDPDLLDSLSVEDLSARVGLPVSAVRRALRNLSEFY
jgi:hypothetical protein